MQVLHMYAFFASSCQFFGATDGITRIHVLHSTAGSLQLFLLVRDDQSLASPWHPFFVIPVIPIFTCHRIYLRREEMTGRRGSGGLAVLYVDSLDSLDCFERALRNLALTEGAAGSRKIARKPFKNGAFHSPPSQPSPL